MASEYQRVDAVADRDGDVVEVGVCQASVIIGIPTPGADRVHLDAAQRERFQRAFMAAERAAETYDPAHPF